MDRDWLHVLRVGAIAFMESPFTRSRQPSAEQLYRRVVSSQYSAFVQIATSALLCLSCWSNPQDGIVQIAIIIE